MKLLGTPPVHPVFLIAGKCAFVPPCVFVAAGALAWTQSRLAFPRAAPFAAAAVVLGLAAVAASIRQLGESLHVGLPDEPTVLKTHGLYRYSRNPIYTGLFLLCAGSCVLVPHWLNISSTVTAIAVHHRIVLAEERFLEGRFGDAWRQYRAKVRRYI